MTELISANSSRKIRQGFGCMGMSATYSTARTSTEESNKHIFQVAIDNGITIFNTATFYGPLNEIGYGENLRLIQKCIANLPRNSYELVVKIGMNTKCSVEETGKKFVQEYSYDDINNDVNYALETLGISYIDVIVLCRIPVNVPYTEYMSSLKAMVVEGKAKAIGLSEASANTIRLCHSYYPLYCIEQEYSLFARDIENDILPVCNELGIKVLAYSPLGRGILTNTIRDDSSLDASDARKHYPKFTGDNLHNNLLLVDAISEIAKSKNCTTGQLSLAWLLAQGENITPIPGTTKEKHFLENIEAENIVLTEEDLRNIQKVLDTYEVKGARYPSYVNTYENNI